MATAVVVQDEQKPIEREVLAEAIVKLSHAVRNLSQRSGLNRKAIVVLLKHSPGMSAVGTSDIEAVLNSIERLERDYCQPTK